MTLRGYIDVITRTTFQLQARNRCGTDDPAEIGSESELAPGRNRPRNCLRTDSIIFEPKSYTGSRTKVPGINVHVLPAKSDGLPFWVPPPSPAAVVAPVPVPVSVSVPTLKPVVPCACPCSGLPPPPFLLLGLFLHVSNLATINAVAADAAPYPASAAVSIWVVPI